MAELLYHFGGARFPAVLRDELNGQARARMTGRNAFRVSTRCCRLAIYLLDHEKQKDAARLLGVSERTAKSDARRLRNAVAAIRINIGQQGSIDAGSGNLRSRWNPSGDWHFEL